MARHLIDDLSADAVYSISDRTDPVGPGTIRVTNGTVPLMRGDSVIGTVESIRDDGHATVQISQTADLPGWGQQIVRDDGYVSVSSGSTYPPPPATAEQMEALLALLRLTEEERAFVRRGLADPSRDFFLVLADWLEEQGRDAASARFRAMGEGRAA